MIRILVFGVLAYLAYRYTHNWYAVGGVVLAYILYGIILGAMSGSRNRRDTTTLLGQKMSDAEKAHFGAVAEHQDAMQAHKAQFDPELRKKS
jgi:disulfide bond formation protein DsbB